jgi:hypothetical protein
MPRNMRPRQVGLRAYISIGVRMACVNEQQTAPARAYLEYSATSPSFLFNDLAIDGSGMCWGTCTGVTRDDDRGEAGACPVVLQIA